MNTRPVISGVSTPVALSVSFNGDHSCFSVGLETGFCVFNADPCEMRASRDLNAGIASVEMLDRTNYMALVGGGRQPRFQQHKVVIWDDSKQRSSITLDFRSQVYQVRLSRNRIVVVLHNGVHVYTFAMPPERVAVYETTDNPYGLVSLRPKVLAFPGRTAGHVQLVEVETGNVSIIPAHTNTLRAIQLSPNGKLLATASHTGTLIRTFCTQTCARTAELRRGVDHADILCLTFAPDSDYLAVTSSKGTLHIFEISGTAPLHNKDDEAAQKWGVLGRLPLMPRVFSDMYSLASMDFAVDDGDGTDGRRTDMSRTRACKGSIGWKELDTLIVVGAGRDGRWERFAFVDNAEGKKVLARNGWKRYLGS